VYMCTELLPPGGYPIAVNKYIVSYHIYQSFDSRRKQWQAATSGSRSKHRSKRSSHSDRAVSSVTWENCSVFSLQCRRLVACLWRWLGVPPYSGRRTATCACLTAMSLKWVKAY